MKVNMLQSLSALSRATDLISPLLAAHHERTAYITKAITSVINLDKVTSRRAFIAALIHDIGGLTEQQRTAPLLYQSKIDVSEHAANGADLLRAIPFLHEIAPIVDNHHVEWAFGKGKVKYGVSIPEESHIVFLSDRIDTLIAAYGGDDFLSASGLIRSIIEKDRDVRFKPQYVDAFLSVSAHESFWLDLETKKERELLDETCPCHNEYISMEQFLSLSRLLAVVIDAHSAFTAAHSQRVGELAGEIGLAAGLDADVILKLKIAGYLHDIGKLAVPVDIIDKPGKLTEDEFLRVKRHSYITGQILSGIDGLEDVTEWAANHHERASGGGYPFGHDIVTLPLCGQIIALADVFVALTEDRAYRAGLPTDRALEIVKNEFRNEPDKFVCTLSEMFS